MAVIPRAMKLYTLLVILLALLCITAAFELSSQPLWIPLVLLAAITVVIEHFAFQLPLAGSVSLSFALVYAALLYIGPPAAIACAMASAVNIHEFREHKPLTLMAFNVGQLTLSAAGAGLCFVLLGGTSLSATVSINEPVLLPAAAAALVSYILNVLLVGGAASILRGSSLMAALRDMGFVAYGSSLVVLALLGYLLAYLLALESWLGVLLLVLPFMATRRVFRVYVELTTAYSETVRSLMAAIEAKDPYTRGHSERVATYARQLGEAIGVSRTEADLLERAGLLHDVGKIGISLGTLTSPSRLTPDEVRAIKLHPILGAEVVDEIEFLCDAVPIIRHHHERVDGAGYPDGMYGDNIPLFSRVLSVADSYDAMTSDRAYRPGMAQEDAVAELVRVAGTQLDVRLVDAFVTMLDAQDTPAGDA